MKRNLLLTALLATSLMASTGCEKASAGKSDTGPTPKTGDWKVTYYFANDQLRTEDYADYTFDFKPKNAITALKDGQSVSGVWAISTKASTQEMKIEFNTGDDKLSAITEDWNVVFVSETQVELIDADEPGNKPQIRFTRQ